MLVLDETRLARNARGEAMESYADKVNRWTREQLGSARIVDDLDLSPCNPQRQLGAMLLGPDKMETILTSFSPNFVFEHVSPSRKRLSFLLPSGSKEPICLYEAGPTPEYSIMNAKWRWEPDPDYALGGRRFERSEARGVPVTLQEAHDLIRDLGPEKAKLELLARRADHGLDDSDYRPGFRKILETWSEAIRGWRSVLTRPLQAGYITLAQAQQAVQLLGGTDDRASWAMRTGQQRDLVQGF